MFPETAAAFKRLSRNIRILWCEKLIGWGLRIRPPDYVPAVMEGLIEHARATRTRTEPVAPAST